MKKISATELMKEYYRSVKKEYPNLNQKEFMLACKATFSYIEEEMVANACQDFVVQNFLSFSFNYERIKSKLYWTIKRKNAVVDNPKKLKLLKDIIKRNAEKIIKYEDYYMGKRGKQNIGPGSKRVVKFEDL